MAPAALIKALGLSPIHVAVFDGNMKKAKELIAKGQVEARSATHHMTTLHFAVILRKFPIVCLLRKRTSLDSRDANGRTPVDYNTSHIRNRYLAWFKRLGYRRNISVEKHSQHSQHTSSLLRYPVRMRSLLARKKHPLSKTVMFLDKKSVVIAKEMVRVPLPELVASKTYGFIASPGDTEIRGFATSGWKYTSSHPKVLPNGKFMQFVQDAAKTLRYNLYAQPHDAPGVARELIRPEDVGRYMASQ